MQEDGWSVKLGNCSCAKSALEVKLGNCETLEYAKRAPGVKLGNCENFIVRQKSAGDETGKLLKNYLHTRNWETHRHETGKL